MLRIDHVLVPSVSLETGKRKDMILEVRKAMYQELLARSKNGRLGKNDTKEVAARFELGLRSVQVLWQRGKVPLAEGIPVDVASRKKGRSGRKPILVDLEPLRNIELKDRTTIEDVARHLGISIGKVQRYLKQGHIKHHSNSIKPFLTDPNKKARLQWCVDMVDPNSLHDDPRFKDLFDHVFIDEKWFFLTHKCENYYLFPDEDEPH
ncbi:hypothetical protein PR202_ga21991 [Eleusine coracana subsp. coracana]|uniref:DUF7769 domain-containing protein n=1 Tax=Eleusine coracana subsp. coracana TaxID=191504 RepID=A0AAV5D207_ELECO|nr:hypothetical protein PR202_ga21991 [Eleusine coracana subsp. coracana]